MEDNSRAQKRVPFITEVEIEGMGVYRSSDLSIGGIYVDTLVTSKPGTLLCLRFKIQGVEEEEITVASKVMSEHKGVGMSMAFVDLSEKDQKALSSFIEKI